MPKLNPPIFRTPIFVKPNVKLKVEKALACKRKLDHLRGFRGPVEGLPVYSVDMLVRAFYWIKQLSRNLVKQIRRQ